MIAYFTDIWDNIKSVISYITIVDIFDIIFLSAILFFCIKLMRETRAEQLIKGIAMFAILLFILAQLQFKVMGIIAETFFNIGILAIIIMFQPELRRMLEKVGRSKVSRRLSFWEKSTPDIEAATAMINCIAESCKCLSAKKTGALIVIEQESKLGYILNESSTIMNAIPSVELFGNVFFPNTPLHDGAVLMKNNIIYAAGCHLPMPAKDELVPKELGTRHRAAIGISEVSDAIVVVVSEETGIISVAKDGNLTRNFSDSTLRKYLTEQLIQENPNNFKKSKKNGNNSKEAKEEKTEQ